MVDVKIKVGRMIRDARTKAGLTQKELGERLSVNQATVSDYEAGNQNFTLDTLNRIANVLQISLKIDMTE